MLEATSNLLQLSSTTVSHPVNLFFDINPASVHMHPINFVVREDQRHVVCAIDTNDRAFGGITSDMILEGYTTTDFRSHVLIGEDDSRCDAG